MKETIEHHLSNTRLFSKNLDCTHFLLPCNFFPTLALCCFLFVGIPLPGNAQETPPLVNYTPNAYKAHPQNWAIDQSSDRLIYAANSNGLLEFDGASWRLYPFPDGQIVRTVLCDEIPFATRKSVKVEKRIYAGGYGEFGFWAKNEKGQLSYTSLSEGLSFPSLKTEEIWHILRTPDYLYFQSFSRIYRYDGKKVEEIAAPGNFMFLRYVHQRLLIQFIGQGLYELQDKTFKLIPGTESLATTTVSSLLPFREQDVLITTAKKGMFILSKTGLIPWNIPVNRELTQNIINKAIKLNHGQGYALGTIRNGVYILDKDGWLLHNLNSKKTLQNNTVLALSEDRSGNLWIGLDQGVDLLRLSSPLLFYQTADNPLGTTYAAALWKGNLYVGSNNGVFVKKWLSNENFRPIPGLEGQTWNLSVVNGELLCGHNDATFRITERGIQKVSDITGGWVFLPLRNGSDTVLLQGAYNGLHLYKKNNRKEWAYTGAIRGVPPLPIKQLVRATDTGFWLAHAYKGLYFTRLNGRLDSVLVWKELQAPGDVPNNFGIELNSWKKTTQIRSNKTYFQPDPSGKLSPSTVFLPEPEPYKVRTGLAGDWFKIFPNRVELTTQNNQSTVFNLSLVNNNETILPLDDSYYFFCLDDGYAIYKRSEKVASGLPAQAPIIRRVSNLQNRDEEFNPLSEATLPSRTRSIRISYALPVYGQPVRYQHRLRGLTDQWSEWTDQSFVEFTNLASGSYTFEVRSSLSPSTTTYSLRISPYWYETLWARLLFVLAGGFALFSLIMYQEKKFEKNKAKLIAEQEEKLRQQKLLSERKIMEIKNENLQKELNHKSQQLSNVAINVVKKNEILEEIRDELKQVKEEMGQQLPNIHYQKLLNSIERNVAGYDDWVLFEENFNEVHEEFFGRLRTIYPSITPSELRLAACLRMNLSTKEMAPVLAISVRGVEIKRYRLRKKMGLDADVNLVEYMMDV